MGMGRRGAAAAPELTQFVAAALHAEAAIAKERRKAREEAEAAAKGAKGTK